MGGERYNRAVPIAGGRRTGIVILVVLFAIALALSQAPFDLGTLRLAGVGLLWWYTLVIAPAAAVLVVAALLLRRSD